MKRPSRQRPGSAAEPCTVSTEPATRPAPLVPVSLSAADKRLLLCVARQTLEAFLSAGAQPAFPHDSAALKQTRAAFVTLWRSDTGELRGCRGESMARRPLIEAVSCMAVAAAADDPRFAPVTLQELPHLRIEINALTTLSPIHAEDVEVGRHGLMAVRGQRAGLLLPDVPVRLGWSRTEFLEGVCHKAGLPLAAWQDADVRLFGFESEEWAEAA